MTNDTTPTSTVDWQRIEVVLKIIVVASLHAERAAREHLPDLDALDEVLGLLTLIRTAAAIARAEVDGSEAQAVAEVVERLDVREAVRLFAEHYEAFFARVALAVADAAAERALHDIRPGRKPGPAIDERTLQKALAYYERNAAHITLEETARRHYLSPRTLSRYRSRRRRSPAGDG